MWHDVIQERVGFARIEQRQNGGMLQVRSDLDLVQEALGAEDGGEFGAEDFDGNLAVVLEVVGEVDRGHAAGAQLALDPIAIRKCRL